MTSDEINKFILENQKKMSGKEIAKKLGISVNAVSKRRVRLCLGGEGSGKKKVDMKPKWKPKIIINGAVTRHISY